MWRRGLTANARKCTRMRHAAVFSGGAFLRAADPEKIAVQKNDAGAAGARVEPVHVLRDEPEVRMGKSETRQGEMPGVRNATTDLGTTRVVPGPDAPRVVREPPGCGQVLERLVLPESAQAAESRHPRFGRDAGPGERRDASPARQQLPETRRDGGHTGPPRVTAKAHASHPVRRVSRTRRNRTRRGDGVTAPGSARRRKLKKRYKS